MKIHKDRISPQIFCNGFRLDSLAGLVVNHLSLMEMEIYLASIAVPFALYPTSHITQKGLPCQSLGHSCNKAQLHLPLPGSCSITKIKVFSV